MAAVAEAAKPGANGLMDYASLGTSMNAVGNCFFHQGRFDEARQWYERAAEARRSWTRPSTMRAAASASTRLAPA
jgi:Tfp pilus assembly protein PilF